MACAAHVDSLKSLYIHQNIYVPESCKQQGQFENCNSNKVKQNCNSIKTDSLGELAQLLTVLDFLLLILDIGKHDSQWSLPPDVVTNRTFLPLVRRQAGHPPTQHQRAQREVQNSGNPSKENMQKFQVYQTCTDEDSNQHLRIGKSTTVKPASPARKNAKWVEQEHQIFLTACKTVIAEGHHKRKCSSKHDWERLVHLFNTSAAKSETVPSLRIIGT
ncbi:hypothetical protein Fot_31662 [Forsythia ovata]|uniref:Uncharacterized protein n=1 Tax=Forsythia ovata TaxID=205694 RepID=A0ABD1T5N5_9LAMI